MKIKATEKERAVDLRRQGLSIKFIAKELGVAKSSVSSWVKNVILSEAQQKALHLKNSSKSIIERRRQSRLLHEQEKRELVMSEASQVIDSISLKDLRLIGLSLYWGEGGKTMQGSARISNSDPFLIKVMMKFFREVCVVDNKKFRALVHIHHHLDAERAERYWSKISGIPRNQFYKTYSKKSIASKNRKHNLPYGTLDVYVCNTKLFLQIIGQINKIKALLTG